MKQTVLAALAAVTAWTMPASAIAAGCRADLVCAANPRGVVDALQTIGYRASLSEDAEGDPRISTAVAKHDYDLAFYGCTKGADCQSLGFVISFEKDSANSAELANLWNKDHRFSTMSFDPSDGSLSISYDVTTTGGLNRENFADVVDWWETMLGNADKFFAEHPAK